MALVGPLLVTARSAEAGPTVLTVEVTLLAGTGSGVPEVTVAVLATGVPDAAEESGLTTKMTLLLAAGASDPIVQVRSPPAPTAGAAQPVPELRRRKVVPAGMESLTIVLVAVLGPALEAVTV